MPSSRRQQTHAWRTAGSGTNSRFGEATFRSLLSPGWWIAFAQRLFQSSIEWWKAATLRARLAVFALGAMYGGLALTALILGPEKIASLLGGLASQISASSQGKLYLLSALVILSIPPLPGYGSAVTLCGLAYGSASIEPKGTHGLFEAWTLAAVGCLLGASIAFALLRFIVKGPGKSWQVITNVTDDRRWNAVQLAIRDKGLAMVVLIRFSPFPFCYSNLFFASMESVSFFQFLVATAMITPKLLLHCFVGARTRELLDSGARQELDWHARMLNIAYILGGSAIGAATGWFVWRETQAILSTYDAEEGLEGSLEADSSPMLGSRRGSVRRARPDRGRVDGPNPQPTQSSGASRPEYVDERRTTPGRGEREADSLLLNKEPDVDDSATSSLPSPDPDHFDATDSSDPSLHSQSFDTSTNVRGSSSSSSSRPASNSATAPDSAKAPKSIEEQGGKVENAGQAQEPFDWGWEENSPVAPKAPLQP